MILVSLAFLQSALLAVPPCSYLPETMQKLLYASVPGVVGSWLVSS